MNYQTLAIIIPSLVLIYTDGRAIAPWTLSIKQLSVATPVSLDSRQILVAPKGTYDSINSDKKSFFQEGKQRGFSLVADKTTTECEPNKGCYPIDPRGPMVDPNTPYIISPSDTFLLNDRPPLSWHAVPDAISYTVRVRDIAGDWSGWERTVSKLPKSELGEITMNYPTEVQALQPGNKYKLIVEAKFASGERRVEPGEATFTMLSPAEIQQVKERVSELEKLNLSPTDKALRVYQIYKEKELIAEAREVLEQQIKAGSKVAQVYRQLGDIYREQGLIDLAKPRYEMAVKLANAVRDSQELEKAQEGLQRTNAALKKRSGEAP
ncbi:MAG: tetratricopeptide repeat protein [Actinomycetota bacterium]